MTSLLDHALALADRGFPVFPVWSMAGDHCSCRDHDFCKPGRGKHADCTPERCNLCSPGKHPITPRGHNNASTNPDQIRKWWELAPFANIGINPPPGVIVVDVDPRHAGHETLAALEVEHGPLPDTLTAKTGGGGLHAFFLVPEGLTWPSELATGIDLKSERGYVLAAPSNHESGQLYEWLTPLETRIAQAPPWLVAKGRQPSESAERVIVEEDERQVANPELDALVEQLRPHFVQGKKHYICKALGGWLKQRGFGFDDVAYVISRLLEPLGINPRGGIDAARWAFGVDKPFGWHELQALIGEAPAAQLDASAPNPRRARELEERQAAAELVPAMAASAVTYQPAPPAAAPSPGTQAPVRDQRLAMLGRVADLTQPPEPLVYICRGLGIAPGKITGLSGYPGTGKGPFLALLALCLASGLPFLGMPVARSRVVLWDLETGRLAETRLHRLANAVGVNVPRLTADGWLVLIHGQPPIAATHIEQVRALAAERSIDAVLFDSYTSGVPGDANVQDHAKVAWELGAISNEMGVTIIGTTHEKKRQERKRGGSDLEMQAGSFALSAAQQTTITLARPDDKNRNLIEVRCARAPEEGFAPFRFQWEDIPDPGDSGGVGGYLTGSREWGLRAAIVSGQDAEKSTEEIAREHAETMAVIKPRILQLLALIDPQKRGMTTEQIRSQLKVAKQDVSDACQELLAERKLEQDKVGHAKPYRLPHAAPYAPPTAGYAPPPLTRVETSVDESLAEMAAGLAPPIVPALPPEVMT